MKSVNKFLDELDDYELAYFSKFKLSTYLENTQSEIKRYLIERNVSESEIERLISENQKSKLNDSKERCPRCFSDKIRRDKVEWTNTGGVEIENKVASYDGLIGRATYKYEVICNVCGFWLKDPNQEKKSSFLEKTFGLQNIINRVLFNLKRK